MPAYKIEAPVMEPIAVVDTFATGVGTIYRLPGGNIRMTLYSEQTSCDGAVELIAVAKIVMPAASAARAANLTLMAVGRSKELAPCRPCLTTGAH